MEGGLGRWWATNDEIRASMRAPPARRARQRPPAPQPMPGTPRAPALSNPWSRPDPEPHVVVHDAAAMPEAGTGADVVLYVDGSCGMDGSMGGA